MSDSVRPHRRQPTRLRRPWDSPGENTGVGCHFLLQCMKVKSESEVAQSCPTLSDPMDCSLPGSSIHGIFQARVLEWGQVPSNNLGKSPWFEVTSRIFWVCWSQLLLPCPRKIWTGQIPHRSLGTKCAVLSWIDQPFLWQLLSASLVVW